MTKTMMMTIIQILQQISVMMRYVVFRKIMFFDHSLNVAATYWSFDNTGSTVRDFFDGWQRNKFSNPKTLTFHHLNNIQNTHVGRLLRNLVLFQHWPILFMGINIAFIGINIPFMGINIAFIGIKIPLDSTLLMLMVHWKYKSYLI